MIKGAAAISPRRTAFLIIGSSSGSCHDIRSSFGVVTEGVTASPRRRKARNAGDVYRHPRAIYACVSFSQKIFCFAKSFLGALSYEPSLCKG